jgi:hypothetical protein
MAKTDDFLTVFEKLKPILESYAADMTVVDDSEGNYYLDTTHIMDNKKPLYFGSVSIRSKYVSFYLMPVYVRPELLDDISDDLRARMQGKSCFNFKRVDDDLFAELAALTRAGHQSYVDQGFIG